MDKNIEELQDEVKVLKNEIKQTLVDVRDYLLTNADNPFPSNVTRMDMPRRDAEADRPAAEAASPPAPSPSEMERGVGGEAPPPVAEVTREAPSDTNGLPASKTNGSTPHPTNGSTPHPTNGSTPHAGTQATAGLMVSVATLAAWLEDGLRSIGGRRLRTIVELHASHGGLPSQLKDVLLQLISLETCERASDEVPLQECLRVLAELENVAARSRSDPNGAAVVSMFLQGTNLISGSQVRPTASDDRGMETRFREWLALQMPSSPENPPDDTAPHKKPNGASARRRG